jgi:hypothetical protein
MFSPHDPRTLRRPLARYPFRISGPGNGITTSRKRRGIGVPYPCVPFVRIQMSSYNRLAWFIFTINTRVKVQRQQATDRIAGTLVHLGESLHLVVTLSEAKGL